MIGFYPVRHFQHLDVSRQGVYKCIPICVLFLAAFIRVLVEAFKSLKMEKQKIEKGFVCVCCSLTLPWVNLFVSHSVLVPVLVAR